ncbi:MAG: hypothetical protein JSW25_03170 [Thermoplasmata archaeon]|nr:MAG: hypothetical protein JSW25_03170 [Thermoplasmata archaeon]
MVSEKRTGDVLVDVKVDIRIVLAALWVAHFLLWTFGDMMSLLQQKHEPIDSTVILIIAPTTATVQALMMLLCLVGPVKLVRTVNLIVAPVFLLFNIGYMGEPDAEVWNYYLGVVYLLFSAMIFWHAWKWPTVEGAGSSEAGQ